MAKTTVNLDLAITNLVNSLPDAQELKSEAERLEVYREFERCYQLEIERAKVLSKNKFDSLIVEAQIFDFELGGKIWQQRPDINPKYFRWMLGDYDKHLKIFLYGSTTPDTQFPSHTVWSTTQAINLICGYHSERPVHFWSEKEQCWLDILKANSGSGLQVLNPQQETMNHRYDIQLMFKWIKGNGYEDDLAIGISSILTNKKNSRASTQPNRTTHGNSSQNMRKHKVILDGVVSELELDPDHFFKAADGKIHQEKMAQRLLENADTRFNEFYASDIDGGKRPSRGTLEGVIRDHINKGILAKVIKYLSPLSIGEGINLSSIMEDIFDEENSVFEYEAAATIVTLFLKNRGHL